MEEVVVKLSGKSLNRPRTIPVACAEHRVYFWNGEEVCETDTQYHRVLFRFGYCECDCCYVIATKYFL